MVSEGARCGNEREDEESMSHARGHGHVMQRGVDVIVSGLVVVFSCLLSGKGPRAERQRSTGHIKHRTHVGFTYTQPRRRASGW